MRTASPPQHTGLTPHRPTTPRDVPPHHATALGRDVLAQATPHPAWLLQRAADAAERNCGESSPGRPESRLTLAVAPRSVPAPRLAALPPCSAPRRYASDTGRATGALRAAAPRVFVLIAPRDHGY
ncbi:Growth arrest-specific protein 7 [Frankliniella fusca]|uniref:Growth arrest-specific protein 7 n=1 Tax=Frankliniella fusca TaxID=407009 RepID=A0AAE1LSR8_9NEOP|nr:Growth arrest-specific protein 7 [Frankliniella fusca]